MNAAVIVPTLNAGSLWKDWISALMATGISPKDVYVIDSGSSDGTVQQANEAGFSVHEIMPKTFNHGGTRQMGVDNLVGYEFIIFVTQDAIVSTHNAFENILLSFNDEQVSAVCGKQLPRKSATLIEAHARFYNYGVESFTRSIKDVNSYGLKTAFISNSFAAYRVATLQEIGGFPKDIIFGEDMFVATKMLRAGYKISYAADASVYHSHGYSLWQEMKRYFDMGVFHSSEPWIRRDLGGAEGEGVKFVVSEVKYLLKNAFWRIPEGMVRTLLRYTGFRLGLIERKLPLWLKKRLAMNKGYFDKC